MSIYSKLAAIQKELKAPKSQWNDFSKFYYRSCEDILEGLKPLLGELVITMSDDVVMVGDRIYIKATITLTDGTESITNTAYAREPLLKKGMDESQISGTASTYARKYALSGLFLIDDAADPDSMDDSKKKKEESKPEEANDKPWYNDLDDHIDWMKLQIKEGSTADKIISELTKTYKVNKKVRETIKELEK